MNSYKEHNENWKLQESLGGNPVLRNTQDEINAEVFFSSYQEYVQKNIKFPWPLKKEL